MIRARNGARDRDPIDPDGHDGWAFSPEASPGPCGGYPSIRGLHNPGGFVNVLFVMRLYPRTNAVVALLTLVAPAWLAAVHIAEHDHGLGEVGLEAPASSSIATAPCDRDGSPHVEGAEIVEREHCVSCILKSRSKSDLGSSGEASDTTPRPGVVRIVALDRQNSVFARLRSPRAPPHA